jgi:hypothetical protein
LSRACEPVDHPLGDLDGIALVVVAPTLKRSDTVVMGNLCIRSLAFKGRLKRRREAPLPAALFASLNPIENGIQQIEGTVAKAAEPQPSCAG